MNFFKKLFMKQPPEVEGVIYARGFMGNLYPVTEFKFTPTKDEWNHYDGNVAHMAFDRNCRPSVLRHFKPNSEGKVTYHTRWNTKSQENQ